MEANSTMMKVVETMLLEASFRDVFSTINSGNKIGIKTRDGHKHAYEALSNVGGKIIMRDLSKDALGAMYVMDRASLNNTDLTIWKYDGDNSKNNDFKGDEINIKVTEFGVINNQSGKLEKVDVEASEDDFRQEENLNRVDDYNNIIQNLDKGDVLMITTETEGAEGGDSIVNDLFFKVMSIDAEWYGLKLDEVQGDAEGEVSSIIQKIATQLTNKFIYIGGAHGFFKVRNDSVGIDLFIVKKNGIRIPIKDIIDVQNNNIEADIDYDDQEKKYSKSELEDALLDDPTFQSMLMKKPSLMDTLRGASPKGLLQLRNMVQQYGAKNSYLTKGNLVKFKMMSPSVRSGDFRHKLLNRKDTYYEAKVTGDKILKLGTVGKGHWEIVLDKEVEDNTYKAEISFCKADRTCNVLSKKSIIKILTNG